jgi:PAS domain S-box-containing protein
LHQDPWSAGPQPSSPTEEERASALAAYGLEELDDDPELTQIVQFAARLCDAPVALLSLVEKERQRFLARMGIQERETPRSSSFCAHAMGLSGIMEVPDARLDPRFRTNPMVTGEPNIRFYAGHPLVSDSGIPLGALCVVDSRPRPRGLTPFQREGLVVLARAVMRRLHSRREELFSARLSAQHLEQRETLLRALADSVPAMVWSADAEGNFDYFNRQMLEFTGSLTSVEGEAIHPDDFPNASATWRESLANGTPYEVEHRLRRADGQFRWVMARAVPVKDEDGRVLRWFGTAIDIDDVHRMSESRDVLARELSHRIKNIFAVVSGLVSLQARKRPEHKEFAEELIGTIRALGRAHDYVRPAGADHRNSLLGLLGDLFSPYVSGGAARVRVVGDDSAIAARAATPLALVFHELATNSAKYGALSEEEGVVQLTIEDRGDKLLLRWIERGGPPPSGSMAEGFGSRLVEMSVTGQLGGSWERRFEPEGMVCELFVSKASIEP